MSDTGGLRLEPGELAHRGFGYIKMRRDVLLNPHRHAPGDIDPAELCDLLGRFGIALIVDGVEDEGSVVELLDHDVRFAQGGAFSPPRPVRADALQAVPDAPGAVPAEDDLTTDRLQGADTLSSEATSSAVPTSDAEKGALRA
jgi:cyclic-di-GMP phosphodiesterase TipF (flagellum assembly factor)